MTYNPKGTCTSWAGGIAKEQPLGVSLPVWLVQTKSNRIEA